MLQTNYTPVAALKAQSARSEVAKGALRR